MLIIRNNSKFEERSIYLNVMKLILMARGAVGRFIRYNLDDSQETMLL